MENFYLCNSVVLQAELSKSAFKVYSFLSMGANNTTRSCYHSKDTIAKKCGVSLSTVTRAIRDLCDKGLLKIKRRFREHGRQTTNLYILIDNPQLKLRTEHPNTGSEKTQQTDCPRSNIASHKGAQDKLRLIKCSHSTFHKKLSPTELKVYTYLSFRAGKDGKCMPAKREIASDCGISLPTVTRAVRQLRSIGLIDVVPQTRMQVYGNNGTSVNLYVLKRKSGIKNADKNNHSLVMRKMLFYFLLPFLTPSPVSPATPQRTISRRKVTLKQRKEYLFSKLTKWYITNIYPRPPGFTGYRYINSFFPALKNLKIIGDSKNE